MNTPIEQIWKEGFTHLDTGKVPVIHDLYNRRSILVTDRLKRNHKLNLIFVGLFGPAAFIGSALAGIPWVGLVLCVLFLITLFLGWREHQMLNELDYGLNSFDYLLLVREWISDPKSTNQSYIRWFYSLIFITVVVGMLSWEGGREIVDGIMSNPDTFLLLGIPVWYVLPLVIIAALMARYGDVIYRMDIRIAYGRTLASLDHLIEEMEALRS